MLNDDNWKKKFINSDGSVEVDKLRTECRSGIKNTLRYMVYKTLLLGFGSEYSKEIEHKNIDGYEIVFNSFQSHHLKGGDVLTNQEESPNLFDILMGSFPEYFSSKYKDEYVFVSYDKDEYVSVSDDKDKYVFVSNNKDYKATSRDVNAYTSMSDNNHGESQMLENMESLPPIKPLIISIEDCKNISEKMRNNIKQIKKDTPRIPDKYGKFECEGHTIDARPIYENVLILYTVITNSLYIQGEWHMMTPFIYNFITYDCKREEDLRKVETNAFLCYTIIRKGLRKDIDANYGNIIEAINVMLKEKEPELYNRITDNGDVPIDALLMKWVGTVFMSIFQFDQCQKIFDFLISYDPQNLPKLLKFLSVEIFVHHKEVIMQYEESKCLELFFNEQKYFTNDVKPKDIDEIIDLAHQYMEKSQQ